jgi:ABC-type oligopeptide transport system ATPase subunit
MPTTSKTFRVFISSTFADMQEERRILQNKVFPRLEKYCESKGARFQAVDLRWGVTEASQLEQKTIDICLNEIKRCQQLSPKPNFIALLGNRYGWQPIPPRIPSTEMKMILDSVELESKSFLTKWYRLDENAIPSEYLLQPRKDEYTEYSIWEKTEAIIRGILRDAVISLPLPDEAKSKYLCSATHLEIIHGALNPPPGIENPEKHVFVYSRNLEGLSWDNRGKNYFDYPENSTDNYSKSQLDALKKELRLKLGDNYKDYEANWDGHKSVIENPDVFADMVFNDLLEIIQKQVESDTYEDDNEYEVSLHNSFKEKLTEFFQGREDVLSKIKSYNEQQPVELNSKDNKPFVLVGASGSGKSSVIAKAIQMAEASHENAVIVYRFIGTTASSSDIIQLLQGVCQQLADEFGESIESLAEADNDLSLYNINDLRKLLEKCFSLASPSKPVILFLDALDQLSDTNNALLFNWLPENLPADAKFIVSALPPVNSLIKSKIAYQLDDLSTADAGIILDKWLSSINRKLTDQQSDEVLSKYSFTGKPIYLKLAYEKAKHWKSYTGDIFLPETVEGIINEFIDFLEQEHTSELVEHLVSYLLCGRNNGLCENEILEILAYDKEYWNIFLGYTNEFQRKELEKATQIPIVVWSRLFLDLEPFLTERDFEGSSVISFFHRQFNEVLSKRYRIGDDSIDVKLNKELERKKSNKYHSLLGSYFENKARGEHNNWQGLYSRGFSEVVYHYVHASSFEKASYLLSNFSFIINKIKKHFLENLILDYELFEKIAPTSEAQKIEIWAAFFQEKFHILRRGNNQWPSHKIFLQLAVEHADESPITKSAVKWLHQDHCDWYWLRRNQRLKEAYINPCIGVLEGHSNRVLGVIEIFKGNILSWSQNESSGLSEILVHDIKGIVKQSWSEKSNVAGALMTNKDCIIIWFGDGYIKIFDKNYKVIFHKKIHHPSLSYSQIFLKELKSGHLLTWMVQPADNLFQSDLFESNSNNDHDPNELKILDEKGNLLTNLKGHRGPIISAIETSDGSIISTSLDKTLILWDKWGLPVKDFSGHSDAVMGVIELDNGKILSWQNHDSLLDDAEANMRLWDKGGNLISLLNSEENIGGVIKSMSGKFISWSSGIGNNEIRFWDNNGELIKTINEKSFNEEIDIEKWFNGERQSRIHTIGDGVIELANGNLISWCHKDIIMLNPDGLKISYLNTHKDNVEKIITTSSEYFVSYDINGEINVWDINGNFISSLSGHSGYITQLFESKQGDLISASGDGTIRVWRNIHYKFETLKKHGSNVHGFIETPEEEYLTWTEFRDELVETTDYKLYLWAKKGHLKKIIDGHAAHINGALITSDSKILSWSFDASLIAWSNQGEFLHQYVGHNDFGWVNGAIETKDGTFISWSGDKTLRVWDDKGSQLAVLKGHAKEVDGAIEVTNDRFLSWSQDKTMRLWNSKGECLTLFKGSLDIPVDESRLNRFGEFIIKALKWIEIGIKAIDKKRVLRGHSDEINGVLVTREGDILSWSEDGTLRLWSLNGKQKCIFFGHRWGVLGAFETRNGDIVSWSSDHSIRLWGKSGHQISVFNGHNDNVCGVIETPQGNFISWADDDNIINWDKKGLILKQLSLSNDIKAIYSLIIEYNLDKSSFLRMLSVATEASITIPFKCNEDRINDVSWFGESTCKLRGFKNDGRVFVTQKNGEVCFLQLMKGSNTVSFNGWGNDSFNDVN